MYKIYRAGVIRISDNKYIDNANHTEWTEYNNWLNQGNIPSPQDPEPHQDKTVDQVRDEKTDRLREKLRKLRGRVNASVGGGDNAIWLMLQKEEAASPGQQGRLISKMAQTSGITPAEVRAIVQSRFSDDRLDLVGTLEGLYLKHTIALKNFTTKQEIENYDIDSGWPDVPLPRSSDR